ncbi:unnamed protein product [Psylliodes chrysocephalus]|uniref:2-aminoethanethiol dioxygenase n=1 Tax=Psylliodes chrysocephalus TaxID=3402493 RepID=A0A9P0GE01_9CUCU|nr:unnamed protein product [Psylliodes chrysocephala]
MATQIQKVLQQAIITFRSDPQTFMGNMNQLSALIDQITCEDINLDISFARNVPDCDQPDVAPMTYIHIYQDGVLSMGVFVLKANKILPLHNHPDMYGLIKVLSGKIRVESYSLNTPKTRNIDSKNYHAMSSPDGVSPRNIVPAEFISSEVCDSFTKPSLLEPHNRNIHEIYTVEGPAAFLHILAPPYNSEVAANPSARRCSFYTILQKVMPEVFVLQEIESPAWYWTDYYPYTGPDVMAGLDFNTM